jgi:hypothetical protein
MEPSDPKHRTQKTCCCSDYALVFLNIFSSNNRLRRIRSGLIEKSDVDTSPSSTELEVTVGHFPQT